MFEYEITMRCGCTARMRQAFDGKEIHIEQITPDHDALVDRYRATPSWKRVDLIDPCSEGGVMLDVNWLDYGSIDPSMRYERTLLLATTNRLGTMHGGDGVMLHPDRPYSYYVAKWVAGRWETTETSAMFGDPIWLEPHEPSHYAEITPPT